MKLTPEEKSLIKQTEDMLDHVLSQVDAARRFKLGDYLIAFQYQHYGRAVPRAPVCNSYGVPKKFQVVAVDKHNVPYIKELNKVGKPTGRLISTLKNTSNLRYGQVLDMEFEIDPDYTDAIILDDSGFDATAVHKDKAAQFKAITLYNKSIKVPMTETKEVLEYMESLKVGDQIWRSNKTYQTVVKIDQVPRSLTGKLLPEEPFIHAAKHNGKIVALAVNSLKHTAVYKTQPRSYNELKDIS